MAKVNEMARFRHHHFDLVAFYIHAETLRKYSSIPDVDWCPAHHSRITGTQNTLSHDVVEVDLVGLHLDASKKRVAAVPRLTSA